MSIEIGSRVQSVNSQLGLMADGDTTIIGTVRALLQAEGGMIKVYWPATRGMTYHYGDDLYLIAHPKRKAKTSNKTRKKAKCPWCNM